MGTAQDTVRVGRHAFRLCGNFSDIPGLRQRLVLGPGPGEGDPIFLGAKLDEVPAANRLQLIVVEPVRERLAKLGYLALHAGAASKNGTAVLLLGDSRSGKSTLSSKLASEGWAFHGDDIVFIRPTDDGFELAPMPLRPRMRETRSKNWALSLAELLPVPVLVKTNACLLAFPEYSTEAGPVRMLPLAEAPTLAQLTSKTLAQNLPAGAATRAFSVLGKLVRSSHSFRLLYNDDALNSKLALSSALDACLAAARR